MGPTVTQSLPGKRPWPEGQQDTPVESPGLASLPRISAEFKSWCFTPRGPGVRSRGQRRAILCLMEP